MMNFAAKKVWLKPALRKAEAKEKKPEVTSNVVSIDLGELENQAKFATGDPVFCSKCKVIYSVESYKRAFPSSNEEKDKKQDKENPKAEINLQIPKSWKCEFCETENELNLSEEEIPQEDRIDYILEPAVNAKASAEEPIILFCIDISGSMGVTTEITGNFHFKGKKTTNNYQQQFGQGFFQAPTNVTYVSRLQCVQAAVENQLEKLKKDTPKAKVGIITFGSDVELFTGDKASTVTMAGDTLNHHKKIESFSSSLKIETPIDKSCAALLDKLWSLEEGGQTALGPALVLAVELASKSVNSKIILATDGLSNIGVGNLSAETEEERLKTADFYETLGLRAKDCGITTNVISIPGSDCNLDNLGKISELTGGIVDVVDPLKLKENFANIMTSKLIATHCQVKIFLHRGLKFHDSEDSISVKDIGNVFADSEVTFDFDVKSPEDLKAIAEKQSFLSLPFQVQVTFRRLNGMKVVRTITKSKQITLDEKEATENIDMRILKQNAAIKSANLAKGGDFSKAMEYGKEALSFMKSNVVHEEQRMQMMDYGGMVGEMNDTLEEEIAPKKSVPLASMASKPKSDKTANLLYKFSAQKKK